MLYIIVFIYFNPITVYFVFFFKFLYKLMIIKQYVITNYYCIQMWQKFEVGLLFCILVLILSVKLVLRPC